MQIKELSVKSHFDFVLWIFKMKFLQNIITNWFGNEGKSRYLSEGHLACLDIGMWPSV